MQEERQEDPGALNLVCLDRVVAHEPAEKVRVPGEIDIVPRHLAAENEVVQPGEELERSAADGGRGGVAGEPPAQRCIQRRAAVAMDGLLEKRLPRATQPSPKRPSPARRARR